MNCVIYVTNIGFPARLSKQKIKWKQLQRVIPVWNMAITFHSNQNRCLFSILRPAVGKTTGWKLKANLWKIVTKGCVVWIGTFVKQVMKHEKEANPLTLVFDFYLGAQTGGLCFLPLSYMTVPHLWATAHHTMSVSFSWSMLPATCRALF